MRGQGEGPKSRAFPSSLWTAASLSSSAPEKLLGVEFTEPLPPTCQGFLIVFLHQDFVLGY